MIIFRLIAPDWLLKTGVSKVIEGRLSLDEVKKHNADGYNVYFFPNHPSVYDGERVKSSSIDVFKWLFVDFDLKSGAYSSKEEFIDVVKSWALPPSRIIDSGNGVHAYWLVDDLNAHSYLRLQKRLIRRFNTDPAVSTLHQLMRFPGTINTKIHDNPKPCEVIHTSDATYSCEQLDKELPPISVEDEKACLLHESAADGTKKKIYQPNSYPQNGLSW